MENLTELFLYQAARIEHVRKVVIPALQAGFWVICDRFTDATIAYQGYARKIPMRTIYQLNHIATGGLRPQLTILLDLPVQMGLHKAKIRSKKGRGDRLENEGLLFQNKVRKGYLALAKKEPRRIKLVRVQPSKKATQEKIQKLVQGLL